jgi:hypothetical protein
MKATPKGASLLAAGEFESTQVAPFAGDSGGFLPPYASLLPSLSRRQYQI